MLDEPPKLPANEDPDFVPDEWTPEEQDPASVDGMRNLLYYGHLDFIRRYNREHRWAVSTADGVYYQVFGKYKWFSPKTSAREARYIMDGGPWNLNVCRWIARMAKARGRWVTYFCGPNDVPIESFAANAGLFEEGTVRVHWRDEAFTDMRSYETLERVQELNDWRFVDWRYTTTDWKMFLEVQSQRANLMVFRDTPEQTVKYMQMLDKLGKMGEASMIVRCENLPGAKHNKAVSLKLYEMMEANYQIYIIQTDGKLRTVTAGTLFKAADFHADVLLSNDDIDMQNLQATRVELQ